MLPCCSDFHLLAGPDAVDMGAQCEYVLQCISVCLHDCLLLGRATCALNILGLPPM